MQKPQLRQLVINDDENLKTEKGATVMHQFQLRETAARRWWDTLA